MKDKIKELLELGSTDEEELRIEKKRISWDHIFLREALLWSEKSHDAETQCGCVLVKDKTPLSTGYNGFIRGIDDTVLPNMRPHKYPFMIHAEINAILNCARQGKPTIGATAYITTKPCLLCFQFLWQAGIARIVYSNLSCSKNWNHTQADGQIEAMMLLINQQGENPWVIKNDKMAWEVEPRLYMEFIPKNDVLP